MTTVVACCGVPGAAGVVIVTVPVVAGGICQTAATVRKAASNAMKNIEARLSGLSVSPSFHR